MKTIKTIFFLSSFVSLAACSQTSQLTTNNLVKNMASFAFNINPTSMTVNKSTTAMGRIYVKPTSRDNWVDVHFDNIPSGITITGGGKFNYPGEFQNFSVTVDNMATAGVYNIDVIATDQTGTENKIVVTITIPAISPGELMWAKQFGSTDIDSIIATGIDSADNIIIAGNSQRLLFSPAMGSSSFFVAKYKPDGSEVWFKQFDTATGDHVAAMSINHGDDIVIVGTTGDKLFGSTRFGSYDAFIARLNQNDGSVNWSKQFGSSGIDQATGLAIDNDDSMIVTGTTTTDLFGTHSGKTDSFIIKFKVEGDESWKKQLGSDGDDIIEKVATNSKNEIITVGNTSGSLFNTNAGDRDIFAYTIDPNGRSLWGYQAGSSSDDMVVDLSVALSDNFTIAGNTDGSFYSTNFGSQDIFAVNFKADGTKLWSNQFSGPKKDSLSRSLLNSSGNVVLVGTTFSTADGSLNASIEQLDATGGSKWRKLFNTDKSTVAINAAIYKDQLVIAGVTYGTTDVTRAFFAKFKLEERQATFVWSKQLSSNRDYDVSSHVLIDTLENIVGFGTTNGKLFTDPNGSSDIFMVKYKKPVSTCIKCDPS